MTAPSRRALELAEVWRAAFVESPPTGRAGEVLGRGVGSSLEFQERRPYQPGDDVRHLDWRAYARTEELMVKVYREEILPRVDLLLDGSRSMRVGEAKAQLATDLCALLATCVRREGYEVRIVELSESSRRREYDDFLTRGAEYEDEVPLENALSSARSRLRPGTWRVLISDFLSPFDAERLVRNLRAGAGGLLLVQVLSDLDLRPGEGAALRIADAETGEERELVLDRTTLGAYQLRLQRLIEGLEVESRRSAASFVSLDSGQDLARLCREQLAPRGILEPA